jgi:hypothetical protein
MRRGCDLQGFSVRPLNLFKTPELGSTSAREFCRIDRAHRSTITPESLLCWEPSLLTATTYLDDLNSEQRRAVEHGVTQGCTVGPPHWCRGMLGALSQNLYISPAAFFIHVQEV